MLSRSPPQSHGTRPELGRSSLSGEPSTPGAGAGRPAQTGTRPGAAAPGEAPGWEGAGALGPFEPCPSSGVKLMAGGTRVISSLLTLREQRAFCGR